MKNLIVILAIAFGIQTSHAELPEEFHRKGSPQSTTNFRIPPSFDLTVSLILPASSKIVSHTASDEGDCIVAQIGDDEQGMVVSIFDKDDQILWTHDFGYNSSATPGCRVCVSTNPSKNAILVHYYGYKWDHSHILLFVGGSKESRTIKEYKSAKSDIQPTLEKRSDFSKENEYLFQPIILTKHGVTFECIPQQRKAAAHPFDQDATWFQVLTDIDDQQRIVPVSIKSTH